MARFTLPRDLYHGKGALEALKEFEGKRAMICVGGGSMKRFGFLDRAKQYLEDHPEVLAEITAKVRAHYGLDGAAENTEAEAVPGDASAGPATDAETAGTGSARRGRKPAGE